MQEPPAEIAGCYVRRAKRSPLETAGWQVQRTHQPLCYSQLAKCRRAKARPQATRLLHQAFHGRGWLINDVEVFDPSDLSIGSAEIDPGQYVELDLGTPAAGNCVIRVDGAELRYSLAVTSP